jgi:hypothetical protein
MFRSTAPSRRVLGSWLLALAVVVVGAVPRADTRASRRDADLLKQKVATITAQAERPTRQGRRTTVTESEVNSYLAYDAREQLPAGVVEPSVTIVGTGRVSGRAIVDLDAVRKARNATSLLDPTSYLTGRLPVTATGVLTTSNGVGRFQLESASVGGVPVPKILLQEIVSYYSRTPDNPSGIGLDDPFALPARIREIQVERGQAIIVQ